MAFYHTYRPQLFSDIIGQDHIVKTLSNQVKNNTVAHAYLFSGPRGVGKTSAARILAKAVNCPKVKGNNFEPDNTHSSAIEISQSRSLDVIEIDAASNTGVDHVREHIIENAHFKPTSLPYKIFIIDEVHMLSTSAFNALLKTLEEPPKHAIFILATTEKHKLPATIISRCQVFNFSRVPFDMMKELLKDVAQKEGVKIDDTVLERISNKSDGCVRDAIGLLDQLCATGQKHITKEHASLVLPTSDSESTNAFVKALIKRDTMPAFHVLDELYDAGTHFYQFAQDCLELLRILLILKSGAHPVGLMVDVSKNTQLLLKDLSTKINPRELVTLIDLTLERRSQIKSAPIPQLPLEMLVAEWCNPMQKDEFRLRNEIELASISEPKTMTDEAKKSEVLQEKKTVVEKIKKIVQKNASFDLQKVKDVWSVFVSKVGEQSPSLSFVLKLAEPTHIEGNTINIGVHHSFHRDKLEESTCQQTLGILFTELLGETAHVHTYVIEESPSATEEKDADLRELANAFGGEVV